MFPDSAGLSIICPCYCFLFFTPLFRKRHSAGESITTTLLSALDSTDLRDRTILREVFDRLQETVFASREQLKNYLRLFAEDQLQYAWESAQQAIPDRKLPFLPTSAAASPPAAGNDLPFRAAENPGEYFLTRSATVEEVFEFICREFLPGIREAFLLRECPQAALDTVGVQLLDHIIVGGTEAMSFAEQKLM